MSDLAYYLRIYIHAHETGNSVPPHIDAEARAALAQEQHPSAAAILALWEELDTDPVAFARAVLERWGGQREVEP